MVAADGPGEYPVVAEARAGDDSSHLRLQSGSVAYITTGGARSLHLHHYSNVFELLFNFFSLGVIAACDAMHD